MVWKTVIEFAVKSGQCSIKCSKYSPLMDHLDFSSPVCRWDWKFQGDLELELGSRAQLKAACHGLSASALQTIHTKSVCLNPPKEVEGIYFCQYHNGPQSSALLHEQSRRALDNSNLLPKCRFQAVAKLLAVTKDLVNRNRWTAKISQVLCSSCNPIRNFGPKLFSFQSAPNLCIFPGDGRWFSKN